jgi:hypothetical protein
MEFVPLAALVIINKKAVDFLKELLPNSLKNRVVQLIAWAVGIGLAFLFAASDFGDGIEVWDGKVLASLNAFGVSVYGLAIGSGAGVLADAIRRKNPEPDPI